MTAEKKVWLSVAYGMRGYFAVLCDKDGPIQSGIGSFENYEGAFEEATGWAFAEGLQLPEWSPPAKPEPEKPKPVDLVAEAKEFF